MRREPSPHARARRGTRQLLASRRRLPPATDGCAANHTEERADGQLTPDGYPRLQLRPRPAIHPDLTTTTTLSVLCRGVGYAELGAPADLLSLLSSWFGF